jgi:hypothetical protein
VKYLITSFTPLQETDAWQFLIFSDTCFFLLCVGKYLTPKRIDIDRYGIEPNFASATTLKEERLELDACLMKGLGERR